MLGAAYGFFTSVQSLSKIKPGDEVILDNSDYLALQTYHRHQVPTIDYNVWDQFRDEHGEPIYPQRPFLVGPAIAHGGAGSVQSGRFEGNLIVVQTLMDESAFPWQADWYRTKVQEHVGEELDERFRLWYVEHALHADTSYVFSKPGTYFPVLRAASHREGSSSDIFTGVLNLARVRVVVS